MTRYGISLLRVAPSRWLEVAQEAERLGFESVWMSEHLVLPTTLDPTNYPDGRLPISPRTPLYDPMVYLAAIAARTTTLRLGTYIFQLGLRHPFVAARAVATLDEVSGGRVELGVGSGWMPEEWAAAGVRFEGRGARLEEAVQVCRRLWSEAEVAHVGRHFEFPSVAFEPKPPQGAGLPVHVGGESDAALRRAVRVGSGWIGMHHTPASVRPVLERLRALVPDGRSLPSTAAATPGPDVDVPGWTATGIDRVIVAPWTRSRDALDGMRRFAAENLGGDGAAFRRHGSDAAATAVARDGIRDLVARYNYFGDRGDSREVAGLFLADATLEVVEGDVRTVATGPEEIEAFLERGKAAWRADPAAAVSRRVFHSLWTHVIDVDGTTATGQAYVTLIRGRGIAEWGRYRDRYRRVDGRWLFAGRRAIVEGRAYGTSLADPAAVGG